MSTPPPPDVIAPVDRTPDEIETAEELAQRIAEGSLAGRIVQGLRLDTDPPVALSTVDVRDALFIGCRFPSAELELDLIRRGALIVPEFAAVPYPTHPGRLYTADDLAAGFVERGFAGMYDTVVYEHFRAHGGAVPDVREALVQRLHDAGIDDALGDLIDDWLLTSGATAAVGVMGGHAVRRGTPAYRLAASLGWQLAQVGRLVVTGGGPGVMEAANLGAHLSRFDPADLDTAIDLLATAPDFLDHGPYTAVALEVRARYAGAADQSGNSAGAADRSGNGAEPAAGTWARRGGLSVPTWLYGHEPANLFAAQIAKYFSNAIREDTILRLARGGVVFAPGWAGTAQEVFQAATKAFYGTDGRSGPMVFLDRAYWTSVLPVESLLRPLLAASPLGDITNLIYLTDDVQEAVAILTD